MAGHGDSTVLRVPGIRELTVIGRGSSSTVYRGHDKELNRWVAVKILSVDDPDDPALARFHREREITANLGKHPHIVQVLGSGLTAVGQPYVVMELYEQGSVEGQLRTHGIFSVPQTVDLGVKIADAVRAAHRWGVLHRDIKPHNVLLSEYGPALADFGIARATANLDWSQGLEHLTPMHAAPEILKGDPPTPEADVYALGSTLYTMLTGRSPFAGPRGEGYASYQQRVTTQSIPPIRRTDLLPGLPAVLDRAMAKQPGDRYRSADELQRALLAVQGAVATPRYGDASMGPAGPIDLSGWDFTDPGDHPGGSVVVDP